jgi:arrestin-related trafficking adapter 1
MKGTISQIEYILRASVTTKSDESIKLSKSLDVKRAIQPPEVPKHSIRIFPPTNITVNCNFPGVMHPIGEGNVSLRIDGMVKRNVEAKTQNQWKLKRVMWRLEETEKAISPACSKHAVKLGNVDDAKKGTPHHDTRTIGNNELKSGWKGDYTTADGSVDLEFPISVRPDSHRTCDLKSEDGTEVTHILVIEIIISDEYAPIKNPSKATPTGAARVLRMHFNLVLSERAGLGISWDEERPPLYEDVPASPPGYGNAQLYDYDGPPLPDYDELLPLDDVVEDASALGNNERGSGDSGASEASQ